MKRYLLLSSKNEGLFVVVLVLTLKYLTTGLVVVSLFRHAELFKWARLALALQTVFVSLCLILYWTSLLPLSSRTQHLIGWGSILSALISSTLSSVPQYIHPHSRTFVILQTFDGLSMYIYTISDARLDTLILTSLVPALIHIGAQLLILGFQRTYFWAVCLTTAVTQTFGLLIHWKIYKSAFRHLQAENDPLKAAHALPCFAFFRLYALAGLEVFFGQLDGNLDSATEEPSSKDPTEISTERKSSEVSDCALSSTSRSPPMIMKPALKRNSAPADTARQVTWPASLCQGSSSVSLSTQALTMLNSLEALGIQQVTQDCQAYRRRHILGTRSANRYVLADLEADWDVGLSRLLPRSSSHSWSSTTTTSRRSSRRRVSWKTDVDPPSLRRGSPVFSRRRSTGCRLIADFLDFESRQDLMSVSRQTDSSRDFSSRHTSSDNFTPRYTRAASSPITRTFSSDDFTELNRKWDRSRFERVVQGCYRKMTKLVEDWWWHKMVKTHKLVMALVTWRRPPLLPFEDRQSMVYESPSYEAWFTAWNDEYERPGLKDRLCMYFLVWFMFTIVAVVGMISGQSIPLETHLLYISVNSICFLLAGVYDIIWHRIVGRNKQWRSTAYRHKLIQSFLITGIVLNNLAAITWIPVSKREFPLVFLLLLAMSMLWPALILHLDATFLLRWAIVVTFLSVVCSFLALRPLFNGAEWITFSAMYLEFIILFYISFTRSLRRFERRTFAVVVLPSVIYTHELGCSEFLVALMGEWKSDLSTTL